MIRYLSGDCRETLPTLEPGSVQSVITSPPYWGLRDYGTPPLVWGGDSEHEHEWAAAARFSESSIRESRAGLGTQERSRWLTSGFCQCGAWLGSLGLEPTPEFFIEHMVECFRHVRRVLRDDGTCWVNLGDSYAGSGKGPSNSLQPEASQLNKSRLSNGQVAHGQAPTAWLSVPKGTKPKDLLMIPFRVAMALQQDGWYLRSVIPWVKRNAMPESVTDRPSTAVEYVFLLAKSSRYYWDADSVRVSAVSLDQQHSSYRPNSVAIAENGRKEYSAKHVMSARQYSESGRNRRNSDWFFESLQGLLLDEQDDPLALVVNPAPFSGAHFACVDEDTECLTVGGWKRHGDLNVGDLAAQFDMQSGLLSWASIEDIARYQVVNQPMVAAKSRDVEMLLTPNHRTVIQRRSGNHRTERQMGKPLVIEAAQLKTQHAIPVAAPWVHEAPQPFSDEWAELVGWYIAEGCETSHAWTVEIYQSRSANPAKVVRIRQLLNTVGAEFSEAQATRLWYGNERTCVAFQVRGFAATFLRQWAPRKRFHPDTLLWPDETLTCLLDGLIDGDGHRRADGRCSFIQRDRESAGIAQAIGVRLGYATMLSARAGDTYSVYFTRKRWITLRGTAGEGARIETQPYTGVVWCPRLPAGTWVARKNGRAFITGNTFPPKLVEPMVKASTSEKGCCPECGAPWVRQTTTEYVKSPVHGDGSQMRSRAEDTSVNGWAGMPRVARRDTTTGWQASCAHTADPVPCTVADPFGGAGTVGLVADRIGRNAVLCELKSDYASMGSARITDDAPLFADVAAD